MTEKITPSPNAAFLDDKSGSGQPENTGSSVYPFLEDPESLGLQAQSEQPVQSIQRARPVRAKRPPQAVPAKLVNKPEITLPGGLGVFLLIALDLSLVALVCIGVYLFLVDPNRLVEIFRNIGSLFAS